MSMLPSMFGTIQMYALQSDSTPLHIAAWKGHTTCMEHLLSTPGIDVDTLFKIFFY